MVQVLDINGVEQGWAYLWGRYGRLELRPAGGRPGFGLAQVRECAGPAVLRVRVLDAAGAPMAAQVALTWPDLQAPAEALPRLGGNAQWANRAVMQVTEAATGETTFALGADSWVKDLALGGPYHVWVHEPWYGGSECLSVDQLRQIAEDLERLAAALRVLLVEVGR